MALAEDKQETYWLSIAALVFGVLGLIILPFALVAIVAGIVAVIKIKKDARLKGSALAIAGIVLGCVGVLTSIIIFSLIVLNWGTGYVESTAADVSSQKSGQENYFAVCNQDVKLKLETFGGVQQICHGGSGASGYLIFQVSNQGEKDIDALNVFVVGSKNGIINHLVTNSSVAIAESVYKNMTYDYTQYGDINKVEIIPALKIPGFESYYYCTEAKVAVSYLQIPSCSGM